MKYTLSFLCLALLTIEIKAQESHEELAKAAQNPLANIMSFPFQNDTNFGYGLNKITSHSNVANFYFEER